MRVYVCARADYVRGSDWDGRGWQELTLKSDAMAKRLASAEAEAKRKRKEVPLPPHTRVHVRAHTTTRPRLILYHR